MTNIRQGLINLQTPKFLREPQATQPEECSETNHIDEYDTGRLASLARPELGNLFKCEKCPEALYIKVARRHYS